VRGARRVVSGDRRYREAAEPRYTFAFALRERLEAAEEDIREGRVLSEDEVEAEIARWFSE